MVDQDATVAAISSVTGTTAVQDEVGGVVVMMLPEVRRTGNEAMGVRLTG